MYWSYLADSKSLNSSEPKLLTFENHDGILEKLSRGYCELVVEEFFSSFANNYDCIFISKSNPIENPSKNEFMFFLKFDDIDKANKILDITSLKIEK
jgi:hypothetical protein